MNKFHKLGTQHSAYIERFEQKYQNIDYFKFNDDNNKFQIINDDNNKFQIINDESIIDNFNSKTTFQQFILVLLSFGFIKQEVLKYKIIIHKFEFYQVTKAIFTRSNDQKIAKYRNSRKLSLLALINHINQENIDNKKIQMKTRLATLDDLLSEVSIWEKTTIKNIHFLIYVLERIVCERK